MNYVYILRAQKVAKYTFVAAVLIVSFHLSFTSKDIFQLNRKERIVSKKLNWVENDVSTVQPNKCNTKSVGVDTILLFVSGVDTILSFVSMYWFFRLGRKAHTAMNCKRWELSFNLIFFMAFCLENSNSIVITIFNVILNHILTPSGILNFSVEKNKSCTCHFKFCQAM
jgi:hypothetical protein